MNTENKIPNECKSCNGLNEYEFCYDTLHCKTSDGNIISCPCSTCLVKTTCENMSYIDCPSYQEYYEQINVFERDE